MIWGMIASHEAESQWNGLDSAQGKPQNDQQFLHKVVVLGNLGAIIVVVFVHHGHHLLLVYFINGPPGRRGERGVGVADEVADGAVGAQLVAVARRREEADRLAGLRHDGVGQQVSIVGHLLVVHDLRD